MSLYELKAERATLHGHFSRDLPPVLTIDPGDSVRFQCLDALWGSGPYDGQASAPAESSPAACPAWMTGTP